MLMTHKVSLGADFDLSFKIYLGNKDAGGADGMAFVLHNDSFGAAALGNGGGGLGAAAIRNGLAIQFDTYQNDVFGLTLDAPNGRRRSTRRLRVWIYRI